jgi:ribonuclease R
VSILPKRRNPKKRPSNRYTAREILDLIATQGGPVDWHTLVKLASADNPAAITQLRQMLKGLQRNDEITLDHAGAYHVPGVEPTVEAIVARAGRAFTADGVPIEDAQRMSLRAGDAVEMRVVDGSARILRVISHADTPVTGVLRSRGRYPYVEGIGGYRGRVSLLEAPKQAKVQGQDGDTVQVRIVDRDRRGLVGVIEEVMVSENVLDQAINTAVAGAHIPNVWPPEIGPAVKRLPKTVNPSRYPDRVDLTTCPLVTIDGETAKDFDDAVFAERLSGKRRGYRLVVAIADVGHYVRPGSVLDNEAVERGTSVYFPERVIPMLPEEISNGLCSLRPETPRLTLVCDMQVDTKGEVVQHEFYESVIYSHARLTYTQVQAFLDGNAELPVTPAHSVAVTNSVRALAEVYSILQAARNKRGALDFETREANMRLSEGRVVALDPVERSLANQLIEEAMIAANVCAARFLEAHQTPALYRVHESPDPDKVEELRQALSFVGVRMAPGVVSPAVMQSALASLPDHADKWLYAQLALRTLKQAVYTPRNQGHFGLALERYMHFTSPIRRYPDLVVHRAIKTVLASKQKRKAKFKIPGMDELQRLGEQCSNNERRAEGAGWLVDAWLKSDFLSDRVGETFDGLVAGVTEFGLFVELKGYYVQGLLHISNLGSDYFEFHARGMALVGERSGLRFALGDTLKVVIREVDPPQGRIDLTLAGNSPRDRSSDRKKEDRKKEGRKKAGNPRRGKR